VHTGPDPYETYKMPIEGFKGTPEEVERQWYEQCFRGRGDTIPQLTVRAVIMGSLLGALLSLTNLYIGLKAGWAFGVAITACILSFAIWTGLFKIGVVRTQMSILENNCMQSTASAAGYSTGGTLVSAFSALILINNETMPLPALMGWVFFLAILGVTMAVPMKRQMINTEQLRFPSGIAAAETLRALHSKGKKGIRAAKALGIAGGLAVVSQFWAEGLGIIKASWAKHSIVALVGRANEFVIGKMWMARTVMFTWDPIFVAGGMLIGTRGALSMLLGSITCWMIYVPLIQEHVPAAAEAASYAQLVQWTLWGGVACMVTSSLLSVALQWRSVVRAFSGLGEMFGSKQKQDDQQAAIETPMSWFAIGQLVALIGLAVLGHQTFGIPYWQSALAVGMSFFIALVACRVTGETDTTPVGPMGKIMQLAFAGIAPKNMNVNIMSANIAAGAATSSADLLTDLKSGYMLGAHPRKQFIAQFSGIFIGTIVTCLTFKMMVPDASALGGDKFPAPAAQTWKGVAVAMTEGISHLHPVKVWSMGIGALLGLLLPLLSRALGEKRGRWVPTPAGIGLAWTFHFFIGLNFAIGAVIGWIWAKKAREHADEFLFPVSAAIVTGGSLTGAFLTIFG
jgi:OPT family oligopeptide transporter